MREMPEDFPSKARAMTIISAGRSWGADTRTIKKWVEEAGGGLREAMLENARHSAVIAGKKQGPKNRQAKIPSMEPLPLDGEAMRFLQRKKGWVCHSNRIYGATKNVHYHIGNRTVSFDELIAIANSYGFSGADSGRGSKEG
jgi:hypothetical protein